MGLLQSENAAQGVTAGPNVKVGRSDFDPGTHPEQGLLLPWVINPQVSYLNFACWIEDELDSGIAIHRPLPQQADAYDSLGSGDIFAANFTGTAAAGVNLRSNAHFTNIAQRMATSIYRFNLKGWSIRAGYQNQIPKGVTIGGVSAIPDDERPQKVIGPKLLSNNYGIPIYYAAWSFWYTCLVPPNANQLPPPNIAEQVTASQAIPTAGIQVPYSIPDANAVTTPVRRSAPITNPTKTI